jgi:hypothetical protein
MEEEKLLKCAFALATTRRRRRNNKKKKTD